VLSEAKAKALSFGYRRMQPSWARRGPIQRQGQSTELKATHFSAQRPLASSLAQDAGLVRILTLTPAIASPRRRHRIPMCALIFGQLIIVPFFDETDDFQPQDFTTAAIQTSPLRSI